MTMDVSRLGVVVETTGVNEARKALDGGNGRGGLLGAAEKAEKAVLKLTDSMGKLIQTNTSGSANAWNQSLSQLGSTLAALNASILATTRALQNMAPAMNSAATATNQAATANAYKASTGNVVTNTLKAMTTAALAYMSVNAATSIVKQADAWLMMEARLKNATGSLNNAIVAQEQMFDLSQRLRVPLEDSVKLYTRLAPAIQRSGKSAEYAKDMVEGISTALQLSGANGAETSSVMLQLSQSFSSGVLNGAEFNAVAENGSVLMRALESYTKKSTYELKKMGSEGKLSMEILGKAIQANLPMWREQFDSLPVTFEGGMQRIKNAWTRAVGQLGQETGFNQRLSQGLRVIEEMLPGIARQLGNMFSSLMSWIDRNQAGLAAMGTQMRELFADSWKVATAFADWVGNLVGASSGLEGFAKVLFAVRVTGAFIADLFSDVGRFIVRAGLFLLDYFVKPLYQAKNAIADINMEMGTFYASMARSSMALGLEDVAKAFALNAVDSLRSAAASKKDYADILVTLNRMRGVLVDIDTRRQKEGTFVEQVLNGEKRRTEELKAQKEAEAEIARLKALHPRKMDDNWKIGNPGAQVDAKAVKAAETARKRHEDAVESLNAKLQEQLVLRDALASRGLDYDKVNPATKEAIRLREHLNNLEKSSASQLEITRVRGQLLIAETTAAYATENERTKERLTAQRAVEDKHLTTINNLREEAAQIEYQVATYGKAKGAVEALELAEAKRRLSMMEGTSDGSRGEDFEKRLAALRTEVELRQRITDSKGMLGQLDADKEFDKLFDPRKAEKFGNVLAEGFGKAGKAMGMLANAADKYLARQAKISHGRAILDKMDKSSVEYATRNQRLMEEETESRLASYADMAGAAKNFFEEGSKGYKALEAAEKTFRLFQMAMQLKSFLQEIGFITTTTAAAIAGDSAKAASATASAGVEVAASTAKGTAAAAAGVANQATGDPYTAFTRMATMAALMAALGFAVAGGGKSVDVAKQRQAAQGTGTVMGDESAKSQSISKSLEILARNSDIALRYSSGMLSSLQNIELSLSGATNGIIRSGNSVTGKNFQSGSSMFGGVGGIGGATLLTGVVAPVLALASKLPLVGNLVGKLASSLFGSKTSLQDSGLIGSNQSVGNIMGSGFNVKAYQDIQTKKKAFGFTYSDKTRTETSALDPAVNREFTNIVSGMVDSLVNAAMALGESGDAVRKKLEAVNIDIGKISLKDLSSEEIQKQLEAIFSAIGDKLSNVALPSVIRFQRAGEGLLETAVRVATGVEQAEYALEKLGITAVSFNQLVQTNGDIGAEIVRQSILAQESSAGIREIISTLSGDASGIAETYKALSDVRNSLAAMRIAGDVSRDLIRAAGGLDSLKDALSSYYDNFFSDSEKAQMKTDALRKEFGKLGVNMPTTRQGFRDLVESFSASGASGQELAAKILLLSSSFADLMNAQENLDSSTQDAIKTAREDLSEAYERESQALIDTRDRFKEFAKSLGEFRSDLLTGDLSTLSVSGKYRAEKSRFEEVLAKAMAGDEGAIGSFQDVATAFLGASRAMNASSSTYTADFQRVLDATEQIQGLASNKASVADRQLAALDAQVKGLLEVNNSVLTVAQAIANLTALLTSAQNGSVPTGPTVGIPSTPSGAQIAAVSNPNVLLLQGLNEQVATLRQELQGLREDQQKQTGELIASNFEANMANASAIVEVANDVNATKQYRERVETPLA